MVDLSDMSAHGDQLSTAEIVEALISNRAVGVELRERADALARISRRPSMRDSSDRQAIGLASSFGEIQSFHHPFYDDVFYGIRARARSSGYDILYFTTPGWQWGDTAPYVELCERYGLVGIVGLAFSFDEPGLNELLAAEFPCVAVDLQLLGRRAGYVSSDNIGGAIMAVEHLHAIGRRRIAFIGGIEDAMTGPERRLGYVSALEKLGLEREDDLIRNASWDIISACEQTEQLMARKPAPDAIFCASDLMAIGALRTLDLLGIGVPDDVAVVGFDDIDLARIVTPSLTTVRQDKVGLGAAAVEVMTRILERPDETPPASVLPVELVIRGSTNSPSGGTPRSDSSPR
ncbi:MAG: LacI family DNA-binding transcriptional regulator [Gaiellaceae bacterium]